MAYNIMDMVLLKRIIIFSNFLYSVSFLTFHYIWSIDLGRNSSSKFSPNKLTILFGIYFVSVNLSLNHWLVPLPSYSHTDIQLMICIFQLFGSILLIGGISFLLVQFQLGDNFIHLLFRFTFITILLHLFKFFAFTDEKIQKTFLVCSIIGFILLVMAAIGAFGVMCESTTLCYLVSHLYSLHLKFEQSKTENHTNSWFGHFSVRKSSNGLDFNPLKDLSTDKIPINRFCNITFINM